MNGLAVRDRRWIVAVAYWAAAVLLLALGLGPPALLWSRLPAQVADHWAAGSSVPNGAHPKAVSFAISGALLLVGVLLVVSAGVLRVWAPRRRLIQLVVLLLGLQLAGQGVAVSLGIMTTNLDLANWHDARHTGGVDLFARAAAPTVLALVATALAWRADPAVTPAAAAPPATLGLGDEEQAFWTGRARCRWALPAAAGGIIIAAALAYAARTLPRVGPVLWWCCLGVAVVAVAVGWLSSITVTASRDGLAVRYGPVRWPSTRIASRRIARADTTEVRGLSWGYRGSVTVFGAAAVIIRPGPALRLHLTNGASFVVTVDDPATAAALINDEHTRSAT